MVHLDRGRHRRTHAAARCGRRPLCGGAFALAREARDEQWRAAIRYGVLDLSGPYRKAFDDSLPDAMQVADPFHVVKLANPQVDECRRRVQNETVGHRGRKDDPLYRSRRLLTKAHERLDEQVRRSCSVCSTRPTSRGGAHDLAGEGNVRGIYQIADPGEAGEFSTSSASICQTSRVRRGPTRRDAVKRWRDRIVAWHHRRSPTGRPKR